MKCCETGFDSRCTQESRHSPQLALLFETARLALLAGLHRLLKLTFSFHVLFIQKHRKISPVTKFGGSGILQFQDF